MRIAIVKVNKIFAGFLEELEDKTYRFVYEPDYMGPPVSLTMPVKQQIYEFKKFPPFFEGLLPEGTQLDALLRKFKIDRNDFFSQLLQVGTDVVGAVTIEEQTP